MEQPYCVLRTRTILSRRRVNCIVVPWTGPNPSPVRPCVSIGIQLDSILQLQACETPWMQSVITVLFFLALRQGRQGVGIGDK